MEVAVYLFTGFLEAGKTKFINESMSDPNFNDGKRRVLILSCEEGEEEYSSFGDNITVVNFDDVTRLTPDRLSAQQKRAKADVVVVEYNGMWTLDSFYNAMPSDWMIYQEVLIADASTGIITEFELNDFEYLLEYGKTHDIFYNYTRFTQTSELAYREEDRERYKLLVEAEKEAGRENAPYGLKVSGLTNGKHAPQELFKVSGGTDASNVVVMVFNFTEYQKELQFESVSFINSIVRSCSNIYQRDIV
jgi:hypothetical protein